MAIVLSFLGILVVSFLFLHWWGSRPDRSDEIPPLLIQVTPAPVPLTVARAVPDSPPAPRDLAPSAPPKIAYDVGPIDQPSPSETVRFRRPADEPIQLLPGRLEVVSGDPRHQEIRLIRVPGRPAEMILGRDPGDGTQHVSLRSSTVSRQHARIAVVQGQWIVANLSRTNPVVVNDEELSIHNGSRNLVDGDRLELGEVVLRYHAH